MEVDLPNSPVAPRLARRALAEFLQGKVSDDAAADAMLATSEVVANAVRHGGLGRNAVIRLSMRDGDGRVRVAVEQETPAPVAAGDKGEPPTAIAEAESGYGFRLLDRITERWGVESGPPGVVWFDIPAAGTSASGSPG